MRLNKSQQYVLNRIHLRVYIKMPYKTIADLSIILPKRYKSTINKLVKLNILFEENGFVKFKRERNNAKISGAA